MIIGENTTTQSAGEIYNKLNQKYAKLDSIDKQEHAQQYEKNDYFRSSKAENSDDTDYQRVLDRYKESDQTIRTHEQTHAAASSITSTPQYDYQMGPDGNLYVTGGEVRVDTSIPKDEEAAKHKLDQISNMSSAPNELSSADAQISRTANLNKMLLETMQGEENAS